MFKSVNRISEVLIRLFEISNIGKFFEVEVKNVLMIFWIFRFKILTN